MICRICVRLEPTSVNRLSYMGVAKQSFSNINKSRSTTPNFKCCFSDQNTSHESLTLPFSFPIDFFFFNYEA